MTDSRELQFQTAHGRRAFWVLAMWVPVLPGAMWIGGELAGDASVSPAFYAVIVAVEYFLVLWWAARRNHLGLFVAPNAVRIGPVVPGGGNGLISREGLNFEIRSDSKLARLWLVDSRGRDERVTAMLLARGSYPGHRLLGGPNHLLVRERSDGRNSGPWRRTGVIWDDGTGADVLGYLAKQVDQVP